MVYVYREQTPNTKHLKAVSDVTLVKPSDLPRRNCFGAGLRPGAAQVSRARPAARCPVVTCSLSEVHKTKEILVVSVRLPPHVSSPEYFSCVHAVALS